MNFRDAARGGRILRLGLGLCLVLVTSHAHANCSGYQSMEQSYYDQVAALVEGGVDILFPETVIDTLNLKACLFAISRYFAESGNRSDNDQHTDARCGGNG